MYRSEARRVIGRARTEPETQQSPVAISRGSRQVIQQAHYLVRRASVLTSPLSPTFASDYEQSIAISMQYTTVAIEERPLARSHWLKIGIHVLECAYAVGVGCFLSHDGSRVFLGAFVDFVVAAVVLAERANRAKQPRRPTLSACSVINKAGMG